jgi:hypothetical protein
VWGLATLDLQHTLKQPAGAVISALLAVEGGVWAGVGRDVVVWGAEREAEMVVARLCVASEEWWR